MRREVLAIIGAVLLAGAACAQTPAGTASAPAAAPPIVSPAPPGSDTCGATALTGLVGQTRSAIPIPVDPSRRRVVCTTCPRSVDYRPDRLTIVYDAQSGRVTSLQCG